ncbi:MAG: helix-turn-helix transcriptional regulator [Nitrososphaerales archaeon]|nr:helix-turn-helix transcriptional regulator [Nitrososphaerales archaeon]
MQEGEFLKSLQDYTNLSGCPIATGFKILGKRWTIEIIREILLGSVKFNGIHRAVPGINPRMLSLRLKELVDHGLVKRTVSAGTPVDIRYSLTKSGQDLIPVMFAMAKFSMKNFPEMVFRDGSDRTPEQVLREIGVSKK